MKAAFLLIAVAALSSCVAKPWMVGSVNDQYGPPKLHGSVDDLETPEASVPAPSTHSGKSPHCCPVAPASKHHGKHKSDEILSPVNHTGSNPSR